MSVNIRNYVLHDFYCINCGKRGLSIPRAGNNFKKTGHRKLMYCPNCRHTVNHIECKNKFEAENFKIEFLAGNFKKEAEEELIYEAAHAMS